MTTRVLSSEEAKRAIDEMAGILTGGLSAELDSLRAKGVTLSDPNVWDGKLANDFRNETWPATDLALKNMQGQLETLRSMIQGINTDIMSAGGNV